jgi:FG-GAP-like repeat
MAVADNFDSTVTMNLGAGDGTFRPGATLAVGRGPLHLVAAHFNNDEALDLAVANYGDGTVGILLGHGDGTFSSGENLAADGPVALAVTDVNRDRIPDLG